MKGLPGKNRGGHRKQIRNGETEKMYEIILGNITG
jgi:hypothetical protein